MKIINIKKINSQNRSNQRPDIDLDFASNGRDKIKRYIEEKYGKNNVVSISTYGRLQLKAALKDISRSFNINYQYINDVSKYIFGNDWEALIEASIKNKEVKDFIEEYPDVIKIISRCLGQVRNSSVHAAGVIICPSHKIVNGIKVKAELEDFMPIKIQNNKEIGEKVKVSEWEGEYLEKIGLLKLDILGIKQLDIIKYITDTIEKNHKKKIELKDVDFNDDKVFEKFRFGDTEAVFQFKSSNQKEYQKLLQPNNIEHLIASNALIRPGAMANNFHNDYVKRKSGEDIPIYYKGLKDITENTYGLLVFEEQIIQIGVKAGLTLVEADLMRAAIKKANAKPELIPVMMQFKDKVINGMISKYGYKRKEAEELWHSMELFTLYSFNRSHACSYALTGYYCQWLKTYYPLEFWLANLEFAQEDERINCINRILSTYKEIKIVFPNINKSKIRFSLNNNEILWSLNHIKGVGEKGALAIIKARKGKDFESMQDFLDRVEKRVVNKRVLLALIYSGAFDEMYDIDKPEERFRILVDYYKIRKEKEVLKQNDSQFYEMEFKRLLNINIFDWNKIIEQYNIEDYVELEHFHDSAVNKSIFYVAGTMMRFRDHLPKNKTKDEDRMGMLTIQQNGVDLDIIMWSDFWNKVKKKIKIGNNYIIKGMKMFDTYRKKEILYSCPESKLIKVK